MNKITQYKQELIKARQRGLRAFSEMNHRLEPLGNIGGVEWINDSKAIDVESTFYALSMFNQPLVWIVEAEELSSYNVFEKIVREKVKAILVFGEDDTVIKNALACVVDDYFYAEELEDVVEKAIQIADENSIVLFSPATKGKIFDDYKERGDYLRLILEEKGLK